jgi:hypothetical protein
MGRCPDALRPFSFSLTVSKVRKSPDSPEFALWRYRLL